MVLIHIVDKHLHIGRKDQYQQQNDAMRCHPPCCIEQYENAQYYLCHTTYQNHGERVGDKGWHDRNIQLRRPEMIDACGNV